MFKYFHICSHRIAEDEVREAVVTLHVKNNGTRSDLLIKGASVLEIKEVAAMSSYNTNYTILPNTYFSAYLKNRIRWHENPPPVYRVIMLVRYDQEATKVLEPSQCLRCQGRGWFVDILNDEGYFENDAGSIKIVQQILKDFLTEISTNILDLEYGTLLKKQVTRGYNDDESLFIEIRMILSEVEQRYLQRQADVYEMLNPEETLVMIQLNKLMRNPTDKRRIIMELRFVTESEDNVFRFGL